MIREKSALGLKALIAFMEKSNVRIDGIKKPKNISSLEQGSITGKRESRIDAERKARDELKRQDEKQTLLPSSMSSISDTPISFEMLKF
jgi:hypothetical protein